MKKATKRCAAYISALAAAVGLMDSDCATAKETAKQDTVTEKVGVYPPPPTNTWKPKLGIPAFSVAATDRGNEASARTKPALASVAADQLVTLAIKSERFQVIERNHLEQLLAEQHLTNLVQEETIERSHRIRGTDYLLLGQVTSFSIKAEKSSGGLGGIGGLLRRGGVKGVPDLDFSNKSSKVTVECGVDLRLVDPQTGVAVAAEFGECKKTDSINGIGISVQGVKAESNGELEISQDDCGKILRLALDAALRKMLPAVDKELLAHPRLTAGTPATPGTTPEPWARLPR